jgi:hypothetical protein
MIESYEEVKKTVHNGNLIVDSVPHALYPQGIGPDGEEDYIPGNVMYKLSHIFRYMIDNEIKRIDFNEYNM